MIVYDEDLHDCVSGSKLSMSASRAERYGTPYRRFDGDARLFCRRTLRLRRDAEVVYYNRAAAAAVRRHP
jgi:hypothetical protein